MSLAIRKVGFLDQLPTEIFEHIITYVVGGRPEGYLPPGSRPYCDPISSYARISRKWRSAIEKYVFSAVVLTASDVVTGKAARILSSRLGFVKSVRFILFLGDLSFPGKHIIDKICNKATASSNNPKRDWGVGRIGIESDTGGNEDESATLWSDSSPETIFKQAMHSLFTILSKIPNKGTPHLNLSIEIHPSTKILSAAEMDRFRQYEHDKFIAYKLSCTYLELPLNDNIPKLPIVRRFIIDLISLTVLIKPSSMCHIASRMTHALFIRLDAGDCEAANRTLRLQLRDGFATALEEIPSAVEHCVINYYPLDEFPEIYEVNPWHEGGDMFSKALHRVSMRKGLVGFAVDAIVLPSIFGSGSSIWARNLREFSATFRWNSPNLALRISHIAAQAVRLMRSDILLLLRVFDFIHVEYIDCQLEVHVSPSSQMRLEQVRWWEMTFLEAWRKGSECRRPSILLGPDTNGG